MNLLSSQRSKEPFTISIFEKIIFNKYLAKSAYSAVLFALDLIIVS